MSYKTLNASGRLASFFEICGSVVTAPLCSQHQRVSPAAKTGLVFSGYLAGLSPRYASALSRSWKGISAAMVATSQSLTHRVFAHTRNRIEERSVVGPASGGVLDPPDEEESSDRPAHPHVDWTDLVERIRYGQESGMEELYTFFGRGIRYYLCRQLGHQELDDKVHDTFLIVVQAIRRGELREPDRLMGFVRTVVRRQVAAHIDRVVHSRRDEIDLDLGVRIADRRRNPEQAAAFHQRVKFMLEVLAKLSDRDREILTRFYLNEESQEQVCDEMGLSETQFRLLKSRAKARFGDIGRRKLQHRPLASFFLRSSPAESHSLVE